MREREGRRERGGDRKREREERQRDREIPLFTGLTEELIFPIS